MAAITSNNIPAKYLNRDFEALKQDLINWAKATHPDKFLNFSDSSPEQIYFEACAYVGDMLSYHIDRNFNESFRSTAQARESLVRIANDLGFFDLGSTPAATEVLLTITVPPKSVTGYAIQPDPDFLVTVKSGLELKSLTGIIFEVLDEVDFSNTTNRKVIPIFDANNQITEYKIQKKAVAKAGKTKIQRFYVSSEKAVPFLAITLDDADVTEILGVTPQDGNVYTAPEDSVFYDTTKAFFETRSLLEGKKFYEINPLDSQNNNVKTGAFINIPRRFIVRKDVNNLTTLTFGNTIPSVASKDIPFYTQTLNNAELGEIPQANTTLFIKYRNGGGSKTSVLPGQINQVGIKEFFSSNNSSSNTNFDSLLKQVKDSLSVVNVLGASGGRDASSIEEIRNKSGKVFSAQDRIVTYSDLVALIETMPLKFGRPYRVSYEELKPRIVNFNDVEQSINTYLDQLLLETTYTGRDLKTQEIKQFLESVRTSPSSVIPGTNQLIQSVIETNNTLLPLVQNGNTMWIGEKARLYLIGINESGQLTTSKKDSNGIWRSQNQLLKENIVEFLKNKRVIGDWIDVTDGRVVNIQVEFTILADRNNRQQTLVDCLNVLRSYFDISKWQMNQPILISNIEAVLQEVPGVISASDIKIFNIVGLGPNNTDPISGREYQPLETGFYRNNLPTQSAGGNRFLMNSVNNIIQGYNDVIFEVKYRNSDILGKVI